MSEERAPAFTAWMAAETAAYTAIHELHQHTQGGRLGAPGDRIEQIARLRKEADVHFASLLGAVSSSQSHAIAPAQPRRKRRRPFELLSRAPAESLEKTRSLA